MTLPSHRTCSARRTIGAVLLLAIVIVAAWTTRADDAAPSKDAPWRSLFDGKSLQNWAATDFGGQGAVLVENGMLILEPGQPLTGVTWKGGELPKVNYELRLEAQKIEGGDFFLALTFPYKDSFCSLVLGGWGGGVTGLSSINGFDASENETTDYHNFEPGRWYKVRVKTTDQAIECWLDDERIIHVETEGKRFSLRIEVDQNRPLGLATFLTKAAYRKIELRELPPP
jgi:hypothetical protein